MGFHGERAHVGRFSPCQFPWADRLAWAHPLPSVGPFGPAFGVDVRIEEVRGNRGCLSQSGAKDGGSKTDLIKCLWLYNA